MIGNALRWLGKETNNRAVTVLLAICTVLGVAVGSAITFVANRVAPIMSPSFSTSDFGEGYRRGRREAELEYRLTAAENSLKLMERSRNIREKIRSMSDKEIDELLRQLGDDRK